MIDLHVHSTASDGLVDPAELAGRLAAAGVTTFSLTDHDTVAGLDAASAAAAGHGLGFLAGIEITAVHEDRDVHVLGYGIDPRSPGLARFLKSQRETRRARVRRIAERLAAIGLPIGPEAVEPPPGPGRSIGRPHVARALVRAGHAASVAEAFDRWLGRGRPAFVPRVGPTVGEVIDAIGEAGGVAGLAHPGVTACDGLIPGLAARGLTAIEVWHSDHDPDTTQRYHALAAELELLATGGSDFHGDGAGRRCRLGEVGTPPDRYERLLERIAALSPLGARRS